MLLATFASTRVPTINPSTMHESIRPGPSSHKGYIELLVIQVSAKKGSNAAQASTDEAIADAAASIAAMKVNEPAGASLIQAHVDLM